MDLLSTKLMLRFWHLYHAFWHWVCEWSLLIDIHVLTTEPGVGDSGSNNYSIRNLSFKSCQALTIVSPNDLRRAPPIMNFLPHGQKASSWNACGCKNWDFLEARTGKPPRYLCHSVLAHMIWTLPVSCYKSMFANISDNIFMISSCIFSDLFAKTFSVPRSADAGAEQGKKLHILTALRTQPRLGKSSGFDGPAFESFAICGCSGQE